jgi:CPA2 family monovalent cation:H+ antiporter-2
MATAIYWGWGTGAAVVFGIALSVASTVVLLRALESRGALKSINGQIAVGWLIVEDLAMVLVLVLLPALADFLRGDSSGLDLTTLSVALAITLGKVGLFFALMLLIGKRIFPALLLVVARSGSRELFTLCVVAAAIAVAYGAALVFDVSFALGAFFAGVIMRESKLSHRAAEESLPLREAFSVLFFVSVGMLFDPAVLVEHPGKVLVVTAIIMIGKTCAAVALVLLFRYPLETALIVGASLAQIGEFSFILATLGATLGLLPPEAQSLILAGALISISTNALMFAAIRPTLKWLSSHPWTLRKFARSDDFLATLPMSVPETFLSEQVVLVGYGRVGQRIAAVLDENDVRYVVADENREVVERLRRQGKVAVAGDAAIPETLIQAHIANASMLIIAVPDDAGVRKMIETATTLNPKIEVVIRTHSDEVAGLLRKEKAGAVFMGEHELAMAMTNHVLTRMGLR